MERNYKVYVHINKINGKRYYGITCQKIKKRWANGYGYKPKKNKNGELKGNEHFWNSICKYGWDNFEHIIIAKGLTKDEAEWLEIELIREWNTTDKKYGYNIAEGGNGTYGYNHNKDTKNKIGESNSKQIYIIELDKTFKSGKECAKFLECSKANISGVLNGKSKTCKGYHIIYLEDKDNKDKIDEVMKYEVKGGYKKQVYVIELNKTFNSLRECAKYLGCNANNISAVLNGKSKTCKGYHIIYEEDKNNKDKIDKVMNTVRRNASKQVYIVELDMIFDSVKECAKFLECSKQAVSRVLNGKSKTCKGYHIIFVKDIDKSA